MRYIIGNSCIYDDITFIDQISKSQYFNNSMLCDKSNEKIIGPCVHHDSIKMFEFIRNHLISKNIECNDIECYEKIYDSTYEKIKKIFA